MATGQIELRRQPGQQRWHIKPIERRLFRADFHPTRVRAEIAVGTIVWRPDQRHWFIIVVNQRRGHGVVTDTCQKACGEELPPRRGMICLQDLRGDLCVRRVGNCAD